MTKACPECVSMIPADSKVCPTCSERIEGKSCPDCLAKSPEAAKVCRWCQHKFREIKQQNTFQPFKVKADTMGTFLIHQRLFPQRASFNTDKLVITTYGFFGLTSHDEEIPWEKVAGFSHHSGIFWDSISIETRGQSAAVIACLNKKDAQQIRNVLQTLER